ncbi:MAG TPA: hypothetical protein ENN38_04000 [Actinobacteria bacterium]|mgnify:CR=1 FL=1|nr:hypothetical protein [Actinomycetota bacterium]
MSIQFIMVIVFLLFVVAAGLWLVTSYTKRTAGVFKELALELGLELKPVGKEYVRVIGSYRGRNIEIGAYEDCKDFNNLENETEKICFGECFTALKVAHNAPIKEAYQHDPRTVVGKEMIFYRFESKSAKDSEMSKDIFISAINKIVELADKLESNYSIS